MAGLGVTDSYFLCLRSRRASRFFCVLVRRAGSLATLIGLFFLILGLMASICLDILTNIGLGREAVERPESKNNNPLLRGRVPHNQGAEKAMKPSPMASMVKTIWTCIEGMV